MYNHRVMYKKYTAPLPPMGRGAVERRLEWLSQQKNKKNIVEVTKWPWLTEVVLALYFHHSDGFGIENCKSLFQNRITYHLIHLLAVA